MGASSSSELYLYAIIPTDEQIIFSIPGAGTENDEVYTIPYREINPASSTPADGQSLAAVVSPSPLPAGRSLNRNDAARYLLTHQRVVEAVMEDFPLLPVKFGTLLVDETQVRRMLAQGKGLFLAALDKYAGQTQMEVIVLWDVRAVFQEISQDEQVLRLKAQIETRLVEDTMKERVALGTLVKDSLERRRAALREEILPSLREIALDMAVNPLMDDSMVVNVALLLDKDGRQALEQRLEQIDAAFAQNENKTPGNTPLTFRCVGPLPPYSFATVEAHGLPFEAVDAARRCLGLGEAAAPEEIKHAYHRLAGQLHPDHNPNLPDAEARMAEITKAYQLLSAYAGEQTSPRAAAPACSFSREAVEQIMLIAVRQQLDLARMPAMGMM